MLKAFGEQWWNRWQQTLARPFDPSDIKRYPALGIDYLIVEPDNRLPDQQPVHENSEYLVYRLT